MRYIDILSASMSANRANISVIWGDEMKAKCIDVTKCTGGNHILFQLLINGTIDRVFTDSITDITKFVNTLSDKEIALVLMYATIKKAAAVTLAQMKAALLNVEWEW